MEKWVLKRMIIQFSIAVDDHLHRNNQSHPVLPYIPTFHYSNNPDCMISVKSTYFNIGQRVRFLILNKL